MPTLPTAFSRVKRLTTIALTVGVVTAATVSPAHAIVDANMGTWTTTLQGRDLDGDLSNGFEAFYDTDLNITWLADANIVGEGFKFLQAQPFLDEHTIYGIEGWQLPYLQPTSDVVDTADKSIQSSLAHLFWVTLGNTPFTGEACSRSHPCADGTEKIQAAPVNTGPFSNLSIDSDIWFNRGDNTSSQIGYGWHFSFFARAIKGADPKNSGIGTKGEASYTIWATHAGDIGTAAVPEPGTYGLILAGLAGLMATRKLRKY